MVTKGKNMNRLKNDISVIVCAYTENRWDDLLHAVDSLKSQTLLPDEIILSIDHNPGLLARVKDRFPELIVVENTEKRGLSGARNSGLAAANGSIIAFIDEDAVAAPDWLARLNDGFSDMNTIGVGGSIHPWWITTKPDWFPEEFNWVVGCTYKGMPESTYPVRNLIGCNMAFRREIFDQAGGFRSEIGRIGTYPAGCEETELCIRARQKNPKGQFIFEPKAAVRHRVPETRTTWKYFLNRCYAEGISKALVSSMVGSQDGLSTERSYTLKTLPQGFFRGIGDGILRRKQGGFGRAAAILIGLLFTGAGYLTGRISLMRNNKVVDPAAKLSLDQV